MADTRHYIDTMVVFSASARSTHAELLTLIHRLIGDGHQMSVAFPDLQAGRSLGVRLRVFGNEATLTVLQQALQPMLAQGQIVSSPLRTTPLTHEWRVFLRDRATEKATTGFIERDGRHRVLHGKRPSSRRVTTGENRASVTLHSHTTKQRFTMFIRALDVIGPEAVIRHGGNRYGLGMATPHF